MSKLLLDSQPLIVLTELAEAIGLNEAIVLQQIHYWLELNKKSNRNFKEGAHWTFNTYEGWQKQFPFWCLRTVKQTILNLEKKGLLISGNFNPYKIDRTKWYRINYDALDSLVIGRADSAQCATGKICPMGEKISTSGDYDPDTLINATPERLRELQLDQACRILSQPTYTEKMKQIYEDVASEKVKAQSGNGKGDR